MRKSVKMVLGVMLGTLMLSGNALAMTFSEPLEIGCIGMSQKVGGFTCKNESANNGDYYTKYNKNNTHSFGKGVARFGNGADALYVHYNVYQNRGEVKLGGENIANTVSLNILNEWIYRIKSDDGITLYAIRFWYGPDSDWRIIGRKKDGTFVKYIDTMDITEKYFGMSTYGASPVRYDIPVCQNDTMIIHYMGQKSREYLGEFRFKWDYNAQWFGVEQVAY